MDRTRTQRTTKLDNRHSWCGISVQRSLYKPRRFQRDNHTKRNGINNNSRYYKYLSAIACLLLSPSVAKADAIGGVSATASPNASSSGQVINQGIQVLQGPYLTNTYGPAQIQCQGPTLNLSPFVTHGLSQKIPYQSSYLEPVYNDADLDEDGMIDNPGEILYYRDIRTGQKDNLNWSLGFSATISIPLDNSLQRRCKRAAEAQIAIMEQGAQNSRLNFEFSRLEKCGILAKKGISFSPTSKAYNICSDVLVTPLLQHNHSISVETSATSSSQKPKESSLSLGTLKSSP